MPSNSFTFADLCSGIGGFHLACVAYGGRCVQACDIDPGAREIYELNYGIVVEPDVIKLTPPRDVDVDLVCFGNPCQPFSTIGQRNGLADKRGGKVLSAICRYLKASNAKAFIMENVKGMAVHEDFQKILGKLQRCGFTLSVKLLNAQDVGSPQHRERVFVVGTKTEAQFDFDSVLRKNAKANTTMMPILNSILDPVEKVQPSLLTKRFEKFDLSGPLLAPPTKSGFRIRAQYKSYTEKRLFSTLGSVGTIMSTHSPFIFDERIRKERHMSVKELLRCQGFPVGFKWPTHLNTRRKVLKYIGNAVHVKVVKSIVGALCYQGFV